jgi:galactokinase
MLTRETVLETKADLKAKVERTLAASGVTTAVRWWWVPGRVEVFGKHTDYGGGPSLMGALPRGFLLAGAPRTDLTVRIVDAGDQSRFELDLATGRTEPAEVTGWRRYANVLARRLSRDFPGAALGADIVLASDLPRASGMSSSSALVVGLAHVLTQLAHLDDALIGRRPFRRLWIAADISPVSRTACRLARLPAMAASARLAAARIKPRSSVASRGISRSSRTCR